MNNVEKQSLFLTSRKDKGVAGLTILLAVVAMVFIIGFLVMVFAIIGASLAENSATPTSVTTVNETGWINQSGYTLGNVGANGFTNPSIVTIINASSNLSIGSGNYSLSNAGVLTNASSVVWSSVKITYTYTYDANNTATEAITDTTTSIAGVSSWFPIIITITVMVALILLTVIIIVAIRSSGILAGGN